MGVALPDLKGVLGGHRYDSRFARISAFLSVDPHQRQGPEIEKARAGGIKTAFNAPISILVFQYLAPSGAEDQ